MHPATSSEADSPVESTPPTILPLVYTRGELAQALSISTDTLDRMRADGRLPSPVANYLVSKGKNSTLFWSRKAIEDWVNEGCPDVADWERRRRRA